LGGVDGFEIAVHTDTNSQIGSSIDAAMAEDFLAKKRNGIALMFMGTVGKSLFS
jgi:hypothetical protein